MKIHVLSLLPEILSGALECGILGRAAQAGLAEYHLHQIREHAEGVHRQVDDYSFGGGPGMVMKPEPAFRAVRAVQQAGAVGPTILLSPQGEPLGQTLVEELAGLEGMILFCARYEGIDERVRQHLVDREISIGDYVLTGGELPALVLIDAVVRVLPGALGAEAGAQDESFTQGLLEYPQYTRPQEFEGHRVPEILLSGHHERIRQWRHEQSLSRTLHRRPDLLDRAPMEPEDREFLLRHGWAGGGATS